MSQAGNPTPSLTSPLARKAVALFFFFMLLEGGYLFFLTAMLDGTERQLDKTMDARRAVAALAGFSSVMQSSSSAVVDQMRISKEIPRYTEIFSRVPTEFSRVKMALLESGGDTQELRDFENNVEDLLGYSRKVVDSHFGASKLVHLGYAARMFQSSLAMTDRIERLNSKYEEIERSNAATLAAQSETLLYSVLIVGFAVNALVAVLFYLTFVRGLVSRLNVISNNIVSFGGGKPLMPPLTGDDEINDLDRSFRKLVRNLEARKTKEAVILDNSAGFLCSLNYDGSIKTVTAKSSALWGFTPEDLIGKRFISLIKDTTPGATHTALREAQEHPVQFENQIELRDGARLDLHWSARAGDGQTIVCVAHDISERLKMERLIARSEENLRRLIDNLPLAVVGASADGKVETANLAASTLSKYDASQLSGGSLAELFFERPDSSESSKRLGELLSAARQKTVNIGLRCQDRTVVPVELDVTTFALGSGEKYLACFRDVSYRMEIEQAKRDFISMITHDLRSPLTAIYGTLTLIAADSPETLSPIFLRSEATIASLITLISDFLLLGKLEAGQDILDREQQSLAAVLIRVERGLDGEPDEDAAESTVYVDSDHMVRTISYLIAAQRYFCGNLKARVDIGARLEDRQLDKGTARGVLISVSAPGAALPQSVRDTCSEGYGLINLDASSGFSPLHLALCRVIVQTHGGSLDVGPGPDGGDAFYIRLPL